MCSNKRIKDGISLIIGFSVGYAAFIARACPSVEPVLISIVTAGLFGDVITTIIALSLPDMIETILFSRWLMKNKIWLAIHISLWMVFVPGLPILVNISSELYPYMAMTGLGVFRLYASFLNVGEIQKRVLDFK